MLSSQSKHLAVQDFSHIRSTPSPHWSALPSEKELATEEWDVLVKARDTDAVATSRRFLPSGEDTQPVNDNAQST